MAMATPVFTLEPDDALVAARPALSPLVFASPHSGDVYPDDLGAREDLPELSLRSAEDALVDRLAAPQPDLGIPLIAARLGRAYVDLNRDPEELDPAVVEGADAASARVAAGFGVIPRLTGDGQVIRHHARVRRSGGLAFHALAGRGPVGRRAQSRRGARRPARLILFGGGDAVVAGAVRTGRLARGAEPALCGRVVHTIMGPA